MSRTTLNRAPAAVHARTLGIGSTVAVEGQRASAGDRGAHAADTGRRL
ncbi:hypothetical protein ACIPC1_02995 [Streptomyces sp. NPDC087263]